MHAARSDASSHLLTPPSWPASQLSPLLQPCFACNKTVQQQDNWYSAWRTLLTPLLTATDEKRRNSQNPKSYPPRQDESERRGRRMHEWMKQARVVFVLSSTVCSITGSAKIDQCFVGRNESFPMCQSPEFLLYLSSESSWRFLTSYCQFQKLSDVKTEHLKRAKGGATRPWARFYLLQTLNDGFNAGMNEPDEIRACFFHFKSLLILLTTETTKNKYGLALLHCWQVELWWTGSSHISLRQNMNAIAWETAIHMV